MGLGPGDAPEEKKKFYGKSCVSLRRGMRSTSAGTSDPPASVLSTLTSAVLGLTEAIERLRQDLRGQADLHAHVKGDDVSFLAAIANAVAGRAFSANELLAHTAVDAELAQALRGVTSAHALGVRLGALAGQNVGGYTVQRIGRDQAGVIWAVTLSELQHSGAGEDVGGGV